MSSANALPSLARLIYPAGSLLRRCFLAGIVCLLVFPTAVPAAQVTLAWDPNPESNLSGYIVFWGTASRNYSNRATIGTQTSHVITGLEEGRMYYFAVAACDTDGNQSRYSTELAYPVPGKDSDGDGIADDDEISIYETDPLHPDTDRDVMDDGWEINHGTDPLVDDADDIFDDSGISNLEAYQRSNQQGDSNSPAPGPDPATDDGGGGGCFVTGAGRWLPWPWQSD